MVDETSVTEWPRRSRPGEFSPPKPKPRLTTRRTSTRISRRKLLGLAAKGGAAAFALTALGRGSIENVAEIKSGVDTSVRSFKSLGRFFHKQPDSVQIDNAQQAETVAKPQTEFSAVFHDLTEKESQEVAKLVRQMHGVIAQNEEYQNGSLYEITKKYEAQILAAASIAGVNPNLVIGIIFVENGGGEAIRNANSGALGIAQLMPETAKRYGLRVDDNIDERKNPEKSIEAMGKYLQDLKAEFLDDGFASWGYHAGEGNVYSAQRLYFKDVDGQDYGDVVETNDPAIAEKYRRLIIERKLNVHKILQNPAVQSELLSQLQDETELYVYKVVAGYQLFEINKAFG